jgi:hypothetical protein
MAECQTSHKKSKESKVSGEENMNFRTPPVPLTSGGKESTLEIKATWKETNMWLARTHPFVRKAL